MMRWWLAGLVAVAIIVGGWYVNQPEPDPPPSVSAVAGTSTDAELCRDLAREAFVMADGIKRQFSLHRAAHRAYTPQGEPDPVRAEGQAGDGALHLARDDAQGRHA